MLSNRFEKRNTATVILLLFFTLPSLAQERLSIQGKAATGSVGIKNLIVINLTTEKETHTAADGTFRMVAGVGDTLVFYSSRRLLKELILSATELQQALLWVPVQTDGYELDEVVVERITPESLGIVPKGQQKYTPSERKLYTAGDFKPVHLLGLLGGSLKIDPILNKINGRTEMFKKMIVTEQKEAALAQLQVYDPEWLEEHYKIPKDYVKGFMYYVAENEEYAAAIAAKNETMATFIMGNLAEKYRKQLPE
ncbi:hypothetical protein [Flavobacterium kingsejongi]|uniref:Uncharacterized protein n=1 Tax=Flavobacterium kingsejongi TaxID=1678728 RepID=A0A2S1LTN4_9FLAO|nr:hypothetical protein [Flavobacterium kingsejongi]AWG27120.1 hypothetical protein FK004_18800 [Flavobacterium kingsejongi]